MIVFPGPCLAFWSLIILVTNIVIHVPEKRAANICKMTNRSPMLAIRREPADHDTQACCLGPTFCNIEIGHFYHGWYIVAIPHPRFVFDLHTWHRCDREQSYWLFINSESQKKKKKKKSGRKSKPKVSYFFIYLFLTSQVTSLDCLKYF